jgi:hypothetical protein
MEPNQRTLELMRRTDALVMGHIRGRSITGTAHTAEMVPIADRCAGLHTRPARRSKEHARHEELADLPRIE